MILSKEEFIEKYFDYEKVEKYLVDAQKIDDINIEKELEAVMELVYQYYLKQQK